MPKITNFAFCEKSSIEDNQPKAINLLQVIETSNGTFSFSIIFSIVGFSATEEHTGYVIVTDPKGDTLMETEKFFLDKDENIDIDSNRVVTGISMGVEFDEVIFEGQGIYNVSLVFDEEKLGEFSIPVLVQRGSEE